MIEKNKKITKKKHKMKFQESIIETQVLVSSSSIGPNMETNIIEKLRKDLENKAFEEYGIVDSIISIEKIIKTEVCNLNADIMLYLSIKISSYMPKNYDVLSIPIKKILPCGIFCEKQNIKVLISDAVNTEKKEKDEIEIILEDIRFDKDSFLCLAKQVETT